MDNSRLDDDLDQGLAFVDCVNISAPSNLSTSVVGGFASICSSPTVGALPSGSPSAVNQGRHIEFNFGTLTNSGGGNATLTIRYRVVVLNSVDNIRGGSLNNQGTWVWSSGSSTDAADPVIIVEPDLNLSKGASPTLVTPGVVVHFTLSISHTAISDTDAFDLILEDALPSGLQFVPGSLDCTLGAQDPNTCVYNSISRTITAVWNSSSGFDLGGGNAVIVFDATVGNLPAGSDLTNTATLEWSSAAGDLSSPQSAHNTGSTERFYDPPDPVNIYGEESSATIRTPSLPDTGFAPGRVTSLGQPTEGAEYRIYGSFILEIPSLGVSTSIVGVPLKDGNWDLDWLWNRAGHLNGTAFPTLQGNTAITAHVYLPSGFPGPFFKIETLRWGDQIIIHAFGQRYIYEVREVRWVQPTDISPFQHEDLDWVTLITCKGYDETSNTYRWRSIVRAVLMWIE